jgi:hypothetical protein
MAAEDGEVARRAEGDPALALRRRYHAGTYEGGCVLSRYFRMMRRDR